MAKIKLVVGATIEETFSDFIVTRCYECQEFPCDKPREFSTKRVIKGISNHANVIPDSYRMKEFGLITWVEEQITRHTCPECGELISWFDMESHTCK